MVVTVIIAALLAHGASAVLKYLSVQEVGNTQTTLNKLQSALNKQWSAAKDQALRETIPPSVQALNLAGTDANATARFTWSM